jgi:hypothetical protein
MNDPFERAVLRERLARRRRQTRHVTAGFRIHARVFAIVSAVLVVLWLVGSALDDGSSWDEPWFLAPVVVWGAALALHGWNVRAHARRDAAMQARLEDSEAAS